MKKEERVFSNDIKINKYKLDDECEQHSSMYHYWSDALADAKTDLDRLKEQKEVIVAERDQYLRKNWDESRWGKQTEPAIKAKLMTDEKVAKIREDFLDAQANVYTLQSAVSSFEHRKSMLDNLVTLFVRQYYSGPNGKREGMTDQMGDEVRDNLNGSKRKRGKE